MQSISSEQVVTWLVSILGGGLAGGIATILFNIINSNLAARRRETAIIEALRGEVRNNLLLCDHNAKLTYVTELPKISGLAPFVEFHTLAITRAIFEERQICPRLGPLQQDLEHYAFGLLQINQLIGHYRILSSVSGERNVPVVQCNALMRRIAALCHGDEFLEGVGPEGSLGLPGWSKHINEELKKV
jgi:hypothetical protein